MSSITPVDRNQQTRSCHFAGSPRTVATLPLDSLCPLFDPFLLSTSFGLLLTGHHLSAVLSVHCTKIGDILSLHTHLGSSLLLYPASLVF